MADITDRWYRTDAETSKRVPTDRYGKGKRWQARWWDGSKHIKRSFTHKGEAQAFIDRVTADLVKGTYIDPDAGRITFREYAEAWRLAQAHRPNTALMVESSLRRHIYPVIGDRPLGNIRQMEIQSLVKRMEQELAPSTVGIVYSFVASIYRAAMLNNDVRTSPCVKVKLPKVQPKRVEPLAIEQVHALVEAMPERYKALVILGAGCGLRQGEAFGLTVDRIDWLRKTLTVDRQLVQVTGKLPALGPLKTDASYRTLPLPEVVLEALSVHLALFPAGPDGLVFTGPRGRSLRRTDFSGIWRPACRRAGLADTITFHDLRHTYASLLIHRGQSIKVVQRRLGHKDAHETLNVYSHMWPDSEDSTRAAVDSVLGAPPAAAPSRAASHAALTSR
jgi:integrase